MAKVGSAKAESKVHGSKMEDKAQENKTHGNKRAKATKDISLKVRRNPSTLTSTPTTIALVAASHRRQAIRQRSMAVSLSHRRQEIIKSETVATTKVVAVSPFYIIIKSKFDY